MYQNILLQDDPHGLARLLVRSGRVALALLVLSLFAPDAEAQNTGRDRRVRLAAQAQPLIEDDGEVVDVNPDGDGDISTRPGRGRSAERLTRAESRELRRALRHGHGPRNGNGRSGRIIRFPRRLASAEAFALGYASGSGIVAEERPSGGGRLLAVRDTVILLSDDSYAWTGQIFVADNPATPVGIISLIERRGVGITGQVQIRTDRYAIQPLGGRRHVLIRVDDTQFPNGGGDPQGDGGTSQTTGSPFIEGGSPLTEVLGTSSSDLGPVREPAVETRADVNGSMALSTATVLVLYTSDARDEYTNIESMIDQAVVNSNTAYSRSAAGANVRLQLVHKQLLSGFMESGDIVGDSDDSLPNNATARALRETYKADIVVLLTRPNAYGAAGRANAIYTPGQPNTEGAYAIVDVAALPIYTFTHEIGHLQGAQHHPEDVGVPDPTRGYSYGRGHRERWSQCFYGAGWVCGYNRFATIMAYRGDDGAYVRVLNFSNPDVSVEDRVTGIAGQRDNALVLRTTASTISAYRTEPLSASIRTSGDPVAGYMFTANRSGGNGTYTYEWRIYHTAYGETGYGGVVETAQSFATGVPYGETYVKVTVRTSSGEAVDAYTFVFRDDPGGGGDICVVKPYLPECQQQATTGAGGQSARAALSTVPVEFALRAVTPNPVSNAGEVTYDLSEATHVEIVVYDALGREVTRLVDGEMSAGSHRAQLSTGHLQPGVYLVRMRAGTFAATSRFTYVR